MNHRKSPLKTTHSKLESLLKVLKESELKEFRKFINSPVYSKGRSYDAILKHYLKIIKSKRKYTGAPAHSQVSRSMKNRTSELYKLAEEFLIFVSLRKKEIEKDILLLEEMNERKLNRGFKNKIRQTERQINSLSIGDEKFQQHFAAAKLNISFLKENLSFEKIYAPYHEFTTNFVCVFLTNLFDFGIEFIQQEMANKKYEFNIAKELISKINLEELMKFVESMEGKLFRLTAMSYYFYKAFENPSDEKNYFKARKIFEKLRGSLSAEMLLSNYNTMTNYCIIRQNQGEKKFLEEIFEVYNERLKLGIYSGDNEKAFPAGTFRNYVMLGTMMKKTAWTNEFIRRYSKELSPENRDDAVKISYSRLEFANRNYEKVLKNLKDLKDSKGATYLHYCDCSVLKLCSYYETEMLDEAYSEIDKLRHYLKNHSEIPKIHKEYFVNFVRIYQRLLNSKSKFRKQGNDLMPLMENSKHISSRLWLEEKILELAEK